MNSLASSNKLNASILTGRDLEPFIEAEMNKAAKGTPFQGTIKCWGGQMFPDIVANRYFGVEVKSTKQNHWTTTGNSVLESTRVDDVERIYMMFGKLAAPIEFKCRPYEDCLSEVVVTHSPRYLIDMQLAAGTTIFDKMKMPYDRLRIHNPPLEPVLDYYRGRLKPGEQIWWLRNGNTSSLVMRFWSSLNSQEKEDVRVKGFVFFPEIFSNRGDKFNDMASWLVQERNIVCPNMRDIYSAGGQATIKANGSTYKGVPRTIANALERLRTINTLIRNTPLGTLTKLWGIALNRRTALDEWIKIVSREVNRGNTQIKTVNLFKDYIAEHGY